jgi:hypothetical protein
VWAWGRLGHRAIAKLAELHLSPAAKAAIAQLLEPGESLADTSTWADEHRRELPKTAPWHYVDIPLDEPRNDARFSGPDPRKGSVVDKLTEFVNPVGDTARSAQPPTSPYLRTLERAAWELSPLLRRPRQRR